MLGHLILEHLILGYYFILGHLILGHQLILLETLNLWDSSHYPREYQLKGHLSNPRNDFLGPLLSVPFHTAFHTEIPPPLQRPPTFYWHISASGITHKYTHRSQKSTEKNRHAKILCGNLDTPFVFLLYK